MLFAVLGSLFGVQLAAAASSPEALASFESGSELELWTPRGVEIALSGERATDGDRSAKVVFTTEYGYPQLRLYLEREPALPTDWSEYEYVAFDVWNASPFAFDLYVKFHTVDEQAHDRTKISLTPGQWTNVKVALDTIPLDMSQIAILELWIWQQDQPVTVYLDNIRLLP